MTVYMVASLRNIYDCDCGQEILLSTGSLPQVDVATLMTQGDASDPNAADLAPSVDADDIPLVVLPNEDIDAAQQDQWCLPGLPMQSCVADESNIGDTEAAADAATDQGQGTGMDSAQDAAAGIGAHGEASASLQYWSSRLLR